MKEKIKNQKGFIQIPLLVIIIASIFVTSAGTGVVLYKQGKLAPLITSILEVFKRSGAPIIVKTETELPKENTTPQPSDEKIQTNYTQAIEQLQQEIIALKQQQQQGKIQNNTQQLQQQMINLQQQLQQAQQQETKSTLQTSSKLDINHITSLVAQVECVNGSGSGFLINSDGVVITNYHVIKEPRYEYNGEIFNRPRSDLSVPGCFVSFTNDPNYPPNVIYWASIPGSFSDQEKDLAVLYIQAEVRATNDLRFLDNAERNFSFIPKCSQNDFLIGDEIIALGYPGAGGDTITVTNGILSGVLGIYYKISAKLNYGNSGGPVILNNEKGCYIGIVTWVKIGVIESQPYAVKAEYVPF